jgi:hypothetical protein
MSSPASLIGLYRLSRKAVSLFGNGISGFALWQLPQCNISSNPYSYGGSTGATGTYGLLNCIAIQYGALSAVVWFYLPPGGRGVLLSFQNGQYPYNCVGAFSSLLYVGTDGKLYEGDWAGNNYYISTPISPGWHMAVVEEWSSSTSGPYYLALYLDGSLVGQTSMSGLPQLFGAFGPFPYSDIAAGYESCWLANPGGWNFFNGAIAYIALYNRVLSSDEVLSIYQGNRISNGLVAEYTGDSYDPSTGTWVDTVNGNNATLITTPNYKPGVISVWINVPTWPSLVTPLQVPLPIVGPPIQPFVPPPRSP